MNAYIKEFLLDAGQRFVPYKAWVGELRHWSTLKADIIAGTTVTLVLVPQAMAYAQLAGLPAYIGLYAAFLVPIVAAIFGSSRQLHNGPVAIISLMTAAALVPLELSPEAYVVYAAMLALMVGVFQMLMGILRLGVLVDFLSHPVVIGFTNAAAIVIGSLQLGKIFGIPLNTGEQLLKTYRELALAIPTQTHWPTLLMGGFSLALLWAFKRYAPRAPGMLLTVVLAIVVSWALSFPESGGKVVGHVPDGLPAFHMPAIQLEHFKELIMPALVIALLSFVEAFSIAKAVASQTRQRISADQEMVGKGLANLTAGLMQGYAVSGSFSRTAVAFEAGAKTGFAAIVSGLLVGATLLYLTPLLYYLPLATLAAVIIVAVIGLIQFEPFKHAWKVNPHDGLVALIVFISTLAFAPHLEKGIYVGVCLSLAFYLYRTMQPHFAEVSRDKDGAFRDAQLFGMHTSDSLAMFRYDGDLYFANARYLENCMLNAIAEKPTLKVVLLDLEAVDQIDATGEETLTRLAENLRHAGIEFHITRPKFKLKEALQRSGLYDRIGEKYIHAKRMGPIYEIKERYGDSVDIEHLERYMPIERSEENGASPADAK